MGPERAERDAVGGYEQSVFINCPYDSDYQPLLRALLFVVLECGLRPRIASERADGGEVRIDKIKDLIRDCRFSIHDLSRMEVDELPRFNLPFELGLDLGCRDFGDAELRRKRCLILEREQYRYRKVLSDISGNDVMAHDDDPQTLIRKVRNWVYEQVHGDLDSPNRIWQRYNSFNAHFELLTRRRGYTDDDIAEMPVTELLDFMETWHGERG